MIRIGVCDDSVNFLYIIKQSISQWENKTVNIVVETFENGDDLIRAHSRMPFDIIILDVVMPLVNGIEVAREIRESDKNVSIVFLTTSPEFALDSYSVKASNYLLKPLDQSKLFACLGELIDDIKSREKSIYLKSGDMHMRVELAKIAYIEAQNKNVMFFLSDGRSIKTAEPLYEYERQLESDLRFFKCHRSYIVNIEHIDSYTQKEILLRIGSRIPISRSSGKEFENVYFSVMFGKVGEMK